jgi:hypothetical protein
MEEFTFSRSKVQVYKKQQPSPSTFHDTHKHNNDFTSSHVANYLGGEAASQRRTTGPTSAAGGFHNQLTHHTPLAAH